MNMRVATWGRNEAPAAMTLLTFSGQQMCFEPLCTPDYRRAALRQGFQRRLDIRTARFNRQMGRK